MDQESVDFIYRDNHVEFIELDRSGSRGELHVDDNGKIAVFIEVDGTYKSEYWSRQDLVARHYVEVVTDDSFVTVENKKTTFSVDEYLRVMDERRNFNSTAPPEKRAKVDESSLGVNEAAQKDIATHHIPTNGGIHKIQNESSSTPHYPGASYHNFSEGHYGYRGNHHPTNPIEGQNGFRFSAPFTGGACAFPAEGHSGFQYSAQYSGANAYPNDAFRFSAPYTCGPAAYQPEGQNTYYSHQGSSGAAHSMFGGPNGSSNAQQRPPNQMYGVAGSHPASGRGVGAAGQDMRPQPPGMKYGNGGALPSTTPSTVPAVKSGTLCTQKFHLQHSGVKNKRSGANGEREEGRSIRLQLICLKEKELVAVEGQDLIDLGRVGMGERYVTIPNGSDGLKVNNIVYDAFPALKAAFLANKKGFRYASRKGRGLALEPRFDWKADYSRFLGVKKLYVVPSFTLEEQEVNHEEESQEECPVCREMVPDSYYIVHVQRCADSLEEAE